MRKTKLKSKLIKTLPNIEGLDAIRQQLETTELKEVDGNFVRVITLDKNLPIHQLTQTIPIQTESITLKKVKKRIKENNLSGYILPTYLLDDVLAKHPLPVSAQKQHVIEYLCRMNNGEHNQAEGINIIYANHHELDPIYNPKIKGTLAPNLASQIESTLHRHRKSRMTLGESKSIDNLHNQNPYGETILQISHLTYHAMDLDLSVEVTKENIGKNKPIKGKVSVLETCSSFPYSLNKNQFSEHGFILYLKGDQITPKKITEIVGLETTGFGGVTIATGTIFAKVLSKKIKGGLFKKKETLYDYNLVRKQKEVVGSFTYDPNVDIVSSGYCNLERVGHLESMSGEIVIAFFPYMQSFMGEYK